MRNFKLSVFGWPLWTTGSEDQGKLYHWYLMVMVSAFHRTVMFGSYMILFSGIDVQTTIIILHADPVALANTVPVTYGNG